MNLFKINQTSEQGEGSIDPIAQKLLGDQVDEKLLQTLNGEDLALKNHVKTCLGLQKGAEYTHNQIELFSSRDEQLIITTDLIEEFRANVFSQISQPVWDSLSLKDNPKLLPLAQTATEGIFNNFFNSRLEPDQLEYITRRNSAYIVQGCVAGDRKYETFPLGDRPDIASKNALGSRANILMAKNSLKILNSLAKDGLVIKNDNGDYMIKGMYLRNSEHETPWVYIRNGSTDTGRSLLKNQREFKIGFKRAMNVLFENNPQLTTVQKIELMKLGHEELYSQGKDKKKGDEERIQLRVLKAREKLYAAGLIEENSAGIYRLKGVSIDHKSNKIHVLIKGTNVKEIKKTFTDGNFEEVCLEAINQFMLNYEKKQGLSIAEKHVLKKLNNIELYL